MERPEFQLPTVRSGHHQNLQGLLRSQALCPADLLLRPVDLPQNQDSPLADHLEIRGGGTNRHHGRLRGQKTGVENLVAGSQKGEVVLTFVLGVTHFGTVHTVVMMLTLNDVNVLARAAIKIAFQVTGFRSQQKTGK